MGGLSVKKAFEIFKRDLKRLLHNPVAVVITIGVCIIPSLYAWYNIEANWDPYGSTEGVKIAVANEDRGVENDLVGSMNAGSETVGELKKNHDLGWEFTSVKQAKEGVERGDYYAAIVIPANFSENLTSMFTDEYEQPKLTYYVNEKKNAIAPKVTDTGAETIEEQINETFVSTVSKTVMDKMHGIEGDLEAQGNEVHAGVLASANKAKDAVQSVRDSLSGVPGTVDATKKALADADKTLADLSGQVPSLTDALSQGDSLLASTRVSTRNFATSLSSALSGGMTKLGQASAKANGVVGTLAGAVASAQGKVDGVLEDVQSVIDVNRDIVNLLEALNKAGIDSGDLTVFHRELMEQIESMQGVKNSLQAQSDAIKNDMGAISGTSSSINDAVQGGVDSLGKTQQALSDNVLPSLTEGLDSFSAVSGDLTGAVSGVTPAVEQARGALKELSALLDQAAGAVSTADTSLANIQGALDSVVNDVAALRSSLSMGEADGLLGASSVDIADFMKAPVDLKTEPVYPVANYGSGVTPFYTNLALWVGGFVLIAIFKLEVDHDGVGAFSATEGYFGRWLLMVLLGLVQAVIVCVGDLALGIQCGQPALFVLAGVLISFVYVNIIYALAIAFKHIGKAIAVILVIVQIPGSSGLYPIEMMPPFFQGLHPLLPFTYGINAMRETIGGMYGANYVLNLGVLMLYFLLAILIGVAMRPLLLNLNLLFDRHLSRTGVMICEQNDLPRERYSIRVAMRAMLDADSYREDLIGRAERFERRYPTLIRLGFGLVFGLPVLLFILTAALDLDINGKIVMLVLWIVAIIAADAYMIAIEYVRESFSTQLRAAALSDDELKAQIADHFSAASTKGGR